MEAKLKTGIYSGSFNPVHIGHLALANWLVEFTELDELWFMITPQNPFKDKHTLMDDGFRLELVRRAIAGYPKFHASDFEFSLPRPSYTYRTLRALEQQYPDRACRFPHPYLSPKRVPGRNSYPLPSCPIGRCPPHRNLFLFHPRRTRRRKRCPFFPAGRGEGDVCEGKGTNKGDMWGNGCEVYVNIFITFAL